MKEIMAKHPDERTSKRDEVRAVVLQISLELPIIASREVHPPPLPHTPSRLATLFRNGNQNDSGIGDEYAYQDFVSTEVSHSQLTS